MNDEHIARIAQDDQTDALARDFVRGLIDRGVFEAAIDLVTNMADEIDKSSKGCPRSSIACAIIAIGIARAVQIHTEIEAEGEGE